MKHTDFGLWSQLSGKSKKLKVKSEKWQVVGGKWLVIGLPLAKRNLPPI
jgi:hypothetical protein